MVGTLQSPRYPSVYARETSMSAPGSEKETKVNLGTHCKISHRIENGTHNNYM